MWGGGRPGGGRPEADDSGSALPVEKNHHKAKQKTAMYNNKADDSGSALPAEKNHHQAKPKTAMYNKRCMDNDGPVAREGGAGLVTHFPVSINNFCITKDMYTINSSLDTSG